MHVEKEQYNSYLDDDSLCPCCGYEGIRSHGNEIEVGIITVKMMCLKCCAKWDGVFVLCDITWHDDNDNLVGGCETYPDIGKPAPK